MGGKVWSPAEERVFWTYIIPRSSKRLGLDRANPEKSWEQLAGEMARKMGQDARRDYTGLGLFEHYFQNAEKQRYSPNAISWAIMYLDQKHEDLHGPKEKKSDKDKNSPETKRDPSPQPSETELPPFHQPHAAPNTPPAKQDDGSSEVSEDPAVPHTTGHLPAGRPHLPAPTSPVSLGNDKNRSERHNRDAHLASRLGRRGTKTARIRDSNRAATTHKSPAPQNPTGNLDDPFVDSSPHPPPIATSGQYNTPAAHPNRDQYPGGGYPSGNASTTRGHGYQPLTGTGYDYNMSSNNTGPAPPAEMYSQYSAAGLAYELPHLQSGGSSSFPASYGNNPRAKNTWEQYVGEYTSRTNNTWDQHGSSDDHPHYSPSHVSNHTSQQATVTGRNNTLGHQGSTSAYPAAGYHTDYHAAQPRYHPLPTGMSSQEGIQQPVKIASAHVPNSDVTYRNHDGSNDDNFVLASWGDDEDDTRGTKHNSHGDQSKESSDGVDADADDDGSVSQETRAKTPTSNFKPKTSSSST